MICARHKPIASGSVRLPIAACCAILVLTFFLVTGSAQGPTSASGPASPATGAATASTCTQTAPSIGTEEVRVDGALGKRDLGKVRVGSVHVVVFAVENAKGSAVAIRQIRGDCECISANNPPTRLEANAVTRVTARYVVPKFEGPYSSELLVLTEDPQRRIIRLQIVCQVAP